jgi:hypothetical protein
MLPRPPIKSQIIHIPTGLYLAYCFSYAGHIHLVLSEDLTTTRNNLYIFDRISRSSCDRYVIHNHNEVFEGTGDEFILVERRV